jgi:hypothetical protein
VRAGIRHLGEKALAEAVKIPKSKAKLKRPIDERHALLRIEKENAWIRSLNRELAETFCAQVTRGDPVTVEKTAGAVWGNYAGEPENAGTIIFDLKPVGRFKLAPLSTTPNSLLTEVDLRRSPGPMLMACIPGRMAWSIPLLHSERTSRLSRQPASKVAGKRRCSRSSSTTARPVTS